MSRDTPADREESTIQPDGGTEPAHEDINYLDREVNLLRPSTPFMRDHLKIIWSSFVLWALVVFGPVTLTALAPEMMTVQMPMLGFPLHYFLVSLGAPTGALILAIVYTRYRDGLDQKYGIDPDSVESTAPETGEATAADGGVEQ
jgi:putative solute:sodium symporter small subunit